MNGKYLYMFIDFPLVAYVYFAKNLLAICMSPALWKSDNGDVLYFLYFRIYSYTLPRGRSELPRCKTHRGATTLIMGVLTEPLPGKRKQQNHPYASVAGLGWLCSFPNTLPIFYHRRFGNRLYNIHSCSHILDNILNIHHRLSVSVSLPLC